GLRYSDGGRVRPADFRRAIERLFVVTPHSPAIRYFAGIAGAQACRRGRRCDLSRGIVTDDVARTVTFRLDQPDGDFLTKLALPFADAVPAGTPGHSIGRHPIPATGPYRIAAWSKNGSIELVRN